MNTPATTTGMAWDTWLTVSQATERIRELLETEFAYVRIQGEIAGLKAPPSGHVYFTLLDGSAQIRAVIWRNTLRRMIIAPTEGSAVRVTGRISVYPPRGEYQLVVEGLQPMGSGNEREMLLRLHARLAAEGLFDPSRKRPLPLLPGCIGVVTSASGAVIHDIVTVLEHRFPAFHLLLAHARVQGSGAATEIAAALDRLNADGRPEVIICGRGGGSGEDLACFNSEEVVRAIIRSRIPVVSAVGHEVDLTLADLAADWRAPTPSAAAERIMPERRHLAERLAHLRHRLNRGMSERLAFRREQVQQRQARLRHPRRIIESWRQRGDDLQERLEQAIHHPLTNQGHRLLGARERLLAWAVGSYTVWQKVRLTHGRERLGRAMGRCLEQSRQQEHTLEMRLQSGSPLAILARGYAVIRTTAGELLRRSDQVQPGDPIAIRLAEGGLQAQVTQCEPVAEKGVGKR